jgi:hypothetical protein
MICFFDFKLWGEPLIDTGLDHHAPHRHRDRDQHSIVGERDEQFRVEAEIDLYRTTSGTLRTRSVVALPTIQVGHV